jgi:hypothetical protein
VFDKKIEVLFEFQEPMKSEGRLGSLCVVMVSISAASNLFISNFLVIYCTGFMPLCAIIAQGENGISIHCSLVRFLDACHRFVLVLGYLQLNRRVPYLLVCVGASLPVPGVLRNLIIHCSQDASL